MGLKLYEVPEAIEALRERIDEIELTGDTAPLLDLLKDIQMDRDEQIVGLGSAHKNLSIEIEAREGEIKRQRETVNDLKLDKERLKGQILEAMDDAGVKKIIGENGQIVRWQKVRATAKVNGAPIGESSGAIKVMVGDVEQNLMLDKVNLNVPKDLEPKHWRTEVRVFPAKERIVNEWKETGEKPDCCEIIEDQRTVVVK